MTQTGGRLFHKAKNLCMNSHSLFPLLLSQVPYRNSSRRDTKTHLLDSLTTCKWEGNLVSQTLWWEWLLYYIGLSINICQWIYIPIFSKVWPHSNHPFPGFHLVWVLGWSLVNFTHHEYIVQFLSMFNHWNSSIKQFKSTKLYSFYKPISL